MGSDQRRDLPERALRWWTKVYFQPLPPESDHSFAGQIGYDCSNTIVGSHGTMLPETETQISRARAIGRVAATAVIVGVAYYVGAKVGLVLRLPPATSSVVWPPNSSRHGGIGGSICSPHSRRIWPASCRPTFPFPWCWRSS